MPAYAPNYTPRLRVRYHAAFANHSQTWRFPAVGVASAGLIAAIAAVQAYYDDLAAIMYDDLSFISMSYAQIDSDIFLPAGTLTLAGTVDMTSVNPDAKAGACSFVGRTNGGQPAKIFQYGIAVEETAGDNGMNFRIEPGEVAEIDTAIAELNGFIAGVVLCGSDGLAVTWYPYANFKDMDYWVKRVRTGS